MEKLIKECIACYLAIFSFFRVFGMYLLFGFIVLLPAFLVIYHSKMVKAYKSIPCKSMILIGSGGHTKEMLSLVGCMDKSLFSPRIYVITDTDTLSRAKVEELERGRTDFRIQPVARVREVGQSLLSVLFYSLPKSLVESYRILKSHRPEMILCNGPGMNVPICLMARLFQSQLGINFAIIYVESICRVRSLSLTGKILRFFADAFFVQWPELQSPGAAFMGRVS